MQDVNSTDSAPFSILALSGGGYKGLFTAKLVAQIEEETGGPFGAHFDLICGTSIGGIIALALATREIPASRIVDILTAAGPRIFTPIEPYSLKKKVSQPYRAIIDTLVKKKTGFTLDRGITSAKHSSTALRKVLEEVFEERVIADLKTRLLIPSANWTKGGPQFFKTPHNPKYALDAKRSLVDIAMATSAAPIYLPNYTFEDKVYVDGALVGNAPGVFGVHEAEHAINPEIEKDIHLLSISALSSKTTANQSETLDKGIAQWGAGLFDLMMACQEQTANFMMQQKLGGHYHMIDRDLSSDQDRVVALDKADTSATSTLLGIAGQTFQEEIAGAQLKAFLETTTPDLDFKSKKELNCDE
ncbi:MAG: CBASS cGAMP-activated phospholipase [Candidatus Thiodiazotropha sp. L084R]